LLLKMFLYSPISELQKFMVNAHFKAS